MQSRSFDRELTQKPTCPFCGFLIKKPRELGLPRGGEMPLGSCPCGSVYACDETGHNLGTAFIEALVLVCDMDWDLAWRLLPEEDYQEKIVENYDLVKHLLVPRGVIEGRRISGALYFVRLHNNIQEGTKEGFIKRLEKSKHEPLKEGSVEAPTNPLTKKDVEDLVGNYNIDPLLTAANYDNKVLRYLQRLLYSGNDLLRQRAADAMGQVAGVISLKDPETISKLLQRLFTSLADTAASAWGAFDAIAEIIRRRGDLFGGYVPQLYPFLVDETRRVLVLRALGRIATKRPDLMSKFTLHFLPFLTDPEPAVRGYTAWLLGSLGAHEYKEELKKLRNQQDEIEIYDNGVLEKKTVGQVASDFLDKL